MPKCWQRHVCHWNSSHHRAIWSCLTGIKELSLWRLLYCQTFWYWKGPLGHWYLLRITQRSLSSNLGSKNCPWRKPQRYSTPLLKVWCALEISASKQLCCTRRYNPRPNWCSWLPNAKQRPKKWERSSPYLKRHIHVYSQNRSYWISQFRAWTWKNDCLNVFKFQNEQERRSFWLQKHQRERPAKIFEHQMQQFLDADRRAQNFNIESSSEWSILNWPSDYRLGLCASRIRRFDFWTWVWSSNIGIWKKSSVLRVPKASSWTERNRTASWCWFSMQVDEGTRHHAWQWANLLWTSCRHSR